MNTARIRTFLFAVFTALCVMLGTPGIVPARTGSSPLVWTAVSAAGFRKCYTITDRNTPVYSDTGLTHKIGEIFPEDEIIVNNVTGQYVDVTYPISSGWKRGYISPSAILLDVNGQGTRTSSGRMTTYKRNSTSATYGNVDPGDVCLILGTSNNMVQIKYPVSGGYKYAFITAEDARNCLGYGDTQPAPSSTDAGTSTYIVKANGGLNLRSGPSPFHSSYGVIPNGSQVSVSSISNGWAAVTWNGRSGYSSAQYLSKSDSSSSNVSVPHGQIVSYKQRDSRWSSVPYGRNSKNQPATVGSAGCGLLSLTNLTANLTGKFIEPRELAEYSLKYGYRENGVGTRYGLYKSFCDNRGSQYGIRYVGYTSSWSDLKNYLSTGQYGAIVSNDGHIMTLVRYDSQTGKYLLIDSDPRSSYGTTPGYAWKTQDDLQGGDIRLRSSFYIIGTR